VKKKIKDLIFSRWQEVSTVVQQGEGNQTVARRKAVIQPSGVGRTTINTDFVQLYRLQRDHIFGADMP